MNSKTFLLLALTLLGQLLVPVMAAPPGTAFTYQGKLNDGATPANGSYDFRFVLYNAAVGGSQVGDILTADNLTVVGGVFTASLDFGAEFDGSPRWIEVAVRPGASLGEFTVLTPRQALTAAPYALYALTPAGPQGIQGPKGDSGLAGPQGTAGQTGPAGAVGPKGDTGTTGTTGAQGPQGPAGATGATGAQGPAGSIGATGAQGSQGVAGATGLQGVSGPQGATGATGSAGAVRPEGLKWRGAWNAATAYVLNDAVALNGSSWQAKLGNTASAPFEGSANWDLLAKKGDPGATGAQGPAGGAGATGSQGAQGPIGPAGAPGTTGTTGPQGSPGPTGPSGAFTLDGTTASFVSGNVGIGTTAPQAKLHVEGGDLLAGAPGKEWIFHTRSHAGSDFLHITDSDDGAYHFEHGLTLNKAGNVGIGPTSGTNKLEVAGNARINGQLNINGPGVNSLATMTVRARPGDLVPFACRDASGNAVFDVLVYGISFPNEIKMFADLYVYGRAKKTDGGTSWEITSDRRLKQDVRAYAPGLNEVLQLRPVRFRYRDDPQMGLTSAHEEVGFIAQEVREVIPEAVAEGKDGYLTLKADPIHWAAINAIRELNTKVEAQRAENAELRQRLEKLEQLIARRDGSP